MRAAQVVIGLLVGLSVSIACMVAGCGSAKRRGLDTADDGDAGSAAFGQDAHMCVGLECQQQNCGTTVTGTVFAPNGQLPLYNAIVYVPNAPVEPIKHGATCDKCGAVTGSPVVTALSDPTGKFTLQNVPVGKSIPLVIQIGKWRRQVVVPEVVACQETPLDPELTRLPKTQSEGDMPKMALTTGGCDRLGCMLPKVGIDSSEIGLASDGDAKALHVYNGNGATGPGPANSARAFWNDASQLNAYDLVILSCECNEAQGADANASKGPPAYQAMADYLAAGGRIFTTDFMYTWYRYSPDPGLSSAMALRGGAPGTPGPMDIDTSFPKGKALGDWLATVTPMSNNKVKPDVLFANIISSDPAKSQKWATSGGLLPGPRVVSVNVPVGVPADQQCGKAVHIDAHLNDNTSDSVDPSYPLGCASALREGEKLLAFFFFDLASCIQNDTEAPQPPQVK